MSVILPIVSVLGFIVTVVGFGLSVDLKYKLGNMHLDISRTAFFKTNDIYASQIPYLEAVAFCIFLFLSIVRFIEYFRLDFQLKVGMYDGEREQYYLIKAKIAQALEWSNIAVTQAFIFLTLALALVIAIIFCQQGENAATAVYDKYIHIEQLSKHDKDELNDLDGQIIKFVVVQIMDWIGLGLIFIQFFTIVVSKLRL